MNDGTNVAQAFRDTGVAVAGLAALCVIVLACTKGCESHNKMLERVAESGGTYINGQIIGSGESADAE